MNWLTVAVGVVCLSACAYGSGPEYDDSSEADAGDAGPVHPKAKDAGHDGGLSTQSKPDANVEAIDASEPDTAVACNPPIGTGVPACDQCLGASCCVEDTACGNDRNCTGMLDCFVQCPLDDAGAQPDPTCLSSCQQAAGATAAQEYDSFVGCVQTSCNSTCY